MESDSLMMKTGTNVGANEGLTVRKGLNASCLMNVVFVRKLYAILKSAYVNFYCLLHVLGKSTLTDKGLFLVHLLHSNLRVER